MIPVQNIYYMLSYAFQILNQQCYKKVTTEKFSNAADMCAAILIVGFSSQLKRGVNREYLPETELLSVLRGRIEISESMKASNRLKGKIMCTYDDFSINSYMNRIVKTTLELLIKGNISLERKKAVRRLLPVMVSVKVLDVKTINWNIHFNQNNQTYRMLIYVCYLVIKGLLQTQSSGNFKLMDFIDEQRMCRLYEKFILEYYRKEHQEVTANSSRIQWQLDDDADNALPIMQTDIMLSDKFKTLIIDAKYYHATMQHQFDAHTIHSGNLYQIFTYVKNKQFEVGQSHEVAGLILYAKTDEQIVPDNSYKMSGNRISAKTLDLDCDFGKIKRQLDNIVLEYFSPSCNKCFM